MQELLRLMRYARPYVARLLFSVGLMFGVGLFEGATAVLLVPIFDQVLNPQADGKGIPLFTIPGIHYTVDLARFFPSSIHNIWTMVAAAILTVSLGKAVFEYAGDYLVHYIGFAVISDLRNQVYEKIIRQSTRFFHDHSTGKLMSAIVNDIEKIQLAVSNLLADFLRQIFTLLVMMTVLCFLD